MPSEESTTGADRHLGRFVDELKRELEAKSRELAEAREQQAATAGILAAMSSSPVDLRRVFAEIAASAAHLCHAYDGIIAQVDGDSLRFVAHHGPIPTTGPVGQATLPLTRELFFARAVLDRQTIHVADIQAETNEYPESRRRALQTGFRTGLAIPLVHAGEAIGAIMLRRAEVRPFTERQIELLKVFADQAVIAIENARLFEAEQASKRELSESLEYQTATSDVLNVISRSPTDMQPVFGAIAQRAALLCKARFCHVIRFDGKLMHFAASYGLAPEAVATIHSLYPLRPNRGSLSGRTILSGIVEEIPDIDADPEYQLVDTARAIGYTSTVGAPIMQHGRPIGMIIVGRSEIGRFPERQIELLKTFADQVVIAIENTRLFEEVQARNRDLTALGEVGRAVSSTLDLKTVLKTIVDRAVELSGTDAGSIFYHRQETGHFELGETSGLDDEVVAKFRKLDIATGQSGLGQAIADRQPLQVPDVTRRASNPLRDTALEAGLRAALVVPLLGSEGALGALVLQRRRTGKFTPSTVRLMQSFADQSAIALENARLFEQIAQKSHELEVASQHKSQFVANMSHELRTPLAAMLGYAELLQEGIYGALPEKTLPILTRIRSNGQHLLGLINTILDISKIEAGQFKLNVGEYALGSIVETVMVATESLAATKKLAFKMDVAQELPYGLGDEQRLTQVLLNLVGNAIKFTDAGEVRITADATNGHFELSVSDTGPGIPAEECEHIFEKFRQVDSSNTRAKGGTGLGLAIAREIVEMHGGRIWVESTVGQGSTFRMELPVHALIAAGGA